MIKKNILFLLLIIFPISVLAHEEVSQSIDHYYSDLYIKLIYIASAIIIISVILAIKLNKKNSLKTAFFLLITIPTIIVTIFLVGSTIYINIIAHTKGPVHWHADFEIYNCDKKVDIINPKGISNRVGSSTFHEHGDNRIHIEGVVVNLEDVNLQNFFKFIGGSITNDYAIIPTNEGILEIRNNNLCNRKLGRLQAFLYTTEDNRIKQEKINNFPEYIPSANSLVPPGDCIIIEFNEEKNKTDYICKTYKVAINKGDLIGS